jgi:hypothetical protein
MKVDLLKKFVLFAVAMTPEAALCAFSEAATQVRS